MDTFREAVKIAVDKRHMKVSDLTEKIGITPTYYYALMRGRKRFNETLEIKICNELGIERQYFLNEGEMHAET